MTAEIPPPRMPEHEKYKAREKDVEVIQEFLEFLRYGRSFEENIAGVVTGAREGQADARGRVDYDTLNDLTCSRLIAGFLGIDERAFEEEKRNLLRHLRRTY